MRITPARILSLVPFLFLLLTAQSATDTTPTVDQLLGTWEGSYNVPPSTFRSAGQPEGVDFDLDVDWTQTYEADDRFEAAGDLTLKVIRSGGTIPLHLRLETAGTWKLEGDKITEVVESEEITPVDDATRQFLESAPQLTAMFKSQGQPSTYTVVSVSDTTLDLYLDSLGADFLLTRKAE